MKRVFHISFYVLMALLWSAQGTFVLATQYRSNAPTGNWGDAGTWQISTNGGASWTTATNYPGQTTLNDTVLIRNGHTVTLNVSPPNAIGRLTVGEGTSGILRLGNNNTARTLSVTGDVTIASGGTFDVGTGSNTTHTVTIGGNLTNNGTLNFATDGNSFATLTLNGSAAQIVSGSNNLTLRNINVSNTSSPIQWNVNANTAGTLTVNANTQLIPGSSIQFNSSTPQGTITGSGTIRVTRTTAPANYVNQFRFSTNTLSSMTVDYSGSGNQTINSAVGPYGALKISGSGTKTLDGAISVNGSVTIEAGTTLDVSASNYNVTLAGNWTNNGGTFTPGTGTVTFNSTTAAQAINGTATSQTFNNITVAKSTQTLSIGGSTTTLTLNGNLTITSGTFAAGTATSINIAGNWTNNGSFTAGTGTVTFTGAGTHTVSGSSTTNFNNVVVNKGTSSSNILDVQSPITMASGGLTLQNGTFRLTSASTITAFTADITTSPYLIPSTAGLWVNGGTISTTANVSFAGLIRVSSGTLNVGDAADERTRSLGGTLIIEGGTVNIAGRVSRPDTPPNTINFTMTAGTLTVGTVGNTSDTYAPIVIDQTGSSFTMSGGTIVIRRSGGTTNLGYVNLAGTSSVTGGTLQIGDASTPTGQTMRINSAVPIYNLLVNATNNPTALLDTNPLTVVNDVTISTGTTLNANNLNITIGGNWTNNGGTFTPGTGTVTFNSTTAAQAITGTAASQTFNNITVAKSGQTLSVSGSTTTLTLNGGLTLTSGTFAAGTATSINIAGDWTNNGGTFTPGTGTVTFNSTTAAQAITGTATSQTFNTLVVNKASQTLSVGGSTTALIINSDLTVSAGTLDLGTATANRASAGGTITVANGATLRIGGTNGFPANYATRSLGQTSTVEYAGGNQVVSAENYGHLTLSGSGTKTFAAGTTGIFSTLTVSGGVTADAITNSTTIDYNGTGAQTIRAINYYNLTISGARTTNNVTLESSGTIGIANAFTVTATFTSGGYVVTGSTIDYNGSSAQTVTVFGYNNLAFSNAGLKTINASITATGDVTVNAGAPVVIASGVTFQVDGNFTNAGTVTSNGTVNVGN